MLTLVDNFPKLHMVFEVHWHGGRLHTSSWLPPPHRDTDIHKQITTNFGRASIAVTSSHRDTDIHQQITINFGRSSITACVTESTRVLDELLRDEGFNLCFSRVTDSSMMQMRNVRMASEAVGHYRFSSKLHQHTCHCGPPTVPLHLVRPCWP